MNDAASQAARRYPGRVKAAVGWDRDQADQDRPSILEAARCDTVVAIGEIGLDYYYCAETASRQQALFREMLSLACACGKPVVVHSRDAEEDTLALLKEAHRTWHGRPGTLGVLHCFTGSVPFAAALLELDMMLGFSGIITFRNAGTLREVVRLVPDERMLVETDTPYLAPEPYRGCENEPAMLYRVAETLANWRGCTPGHIAEQTTRNAEYLFGTWS